MCKWFKEILVKTDKMNKTNKINNLEDSTKSSLGEVIEPKELDENELNLSLRIEKSEEEINKPYIESKYLLFNGEKIPIDWNKVVLWTDTNGLKIPETHYKEQKSRKSKQFVIHYDACVSSKVCFEVLKQRGLSVHFLIDGDGTIYQLTDCSNICWHAKGVNSTSIGVEISNPYYIKYNTSQEKLWGLKRDIVKTCKVHNKETAPFLDFYPIQVAACKALIKSLSLNGLELNYPSGPNTELYRGVLKNVIEFSGVIGHYNVSSAKIDPGSFPIDVIVDELNSGFRKIKKVQD